MSIVSDFAKSMMAQAAPMIGQESVTIGELILSCVLAEISDDKDFSTGGFEVIKRLSAVCLTADLPVSTVVKKSATARGETFRVASITRGGTFSTLMLEQITKA
jgi:hypothetical protein